MRTLFTTGGIRAVLVVLLLLPMLAVTSPPASAADAAELEFLEIINTYRANKGLPVLKPVESQGVV